MVSVSCVREYTNRVRSVKYVADHFCVYDICARPIMAKVGQARVHPCLPRLKSYGCRARDI